MFISVKTITTLFSRQVFKNNFCLMTTKLKLETIFLKKKEKKRQNIGLIKRHFFCPIFITTFNVVTTIFKTKFPTQYNVTILFNTNTHFVKSTFYITFFLCCFEGGKKFKVKTE